MIVYVTKAYHFNAGHRLFDPSRDDDWNLRVFGKCSYPGGHGHNYRLEVTVRGTPDATSGLLLREADLDLAVEAEVLEKIDHRNLNEVLSQDFGKTPTTEVLVLELWRAIEKRISPPAVLYRIKVAETEKNFFEFFGP